MKNKKELTIVSFLTIAILIGIFVDFFSSNLLFSNSYAQISNTEIPTIRKTGQKGLGVIKTPATVEMLFNCKTELESKSGTAAETVKKTGGGISTQWKSGENRDYCDSEGECYFNIADTSCAGDCFSYSCPESLSGLLTVDIGANGEGTCSGFICDENGDPKSPPPTPIIKKKVWDCAEEKQKYVATRSQGWSTPSNKTDVVVYDTDGSPTYWKVWCENGGYLNKIDTKNPANSLCTGLRCERGNVNLSSATIKAVAEKTFACTLKIDEFLTDPSSSPSSSPSTTPVSFTDGDGVEYLISCPAGSGNLTMPTEPKQNPVCYKPDCDSTGAVSWKIPVPAIVDPVQCNPGALNGFTAGGSLIATFTGGDGNNYEAKCNDGSYNIANTASAPSGQPSTDPEYGHNYECSIPKCQANKYVEARKVRATTRMLPCDEAGKTAFLAASAPSSLSFSDGADDYLAYCPPGSSGIFNSTPTAKTFAYKCKTAVCSGSKYVAGDLVDALLKKTRNCSDEITKFIGALPSSSPSVTQKQMRSTSGEDWTVSCPNNTGSLTWNADKPTSSTCRPAVCAGTPPAGGWSTTSTVPAIVSNKCAVENSAAYNPTTITWTAAPGEDNAGSTFTATCPAGTGKIELVSQTYNINRVENFPQVCTTAQNTVTRSEIWQNGDPHCSSRWWDWGDKGSDCWVDNGGYRWSCSGWTYQTFGANQFWGCSRTENVQTCTDAYSVQHTESHTYKRPFCKAKTACNNGVPEFTNKVPPTGWPPNGSCGTGSTNCAPPGITPDPDLPAPPPTTTFDCNSAIADAKRTSPIPSGYLNNEEFWDGTSKFSCGTQPTKKEKVGTGYNCKPAVYSCANNRVVVSDGAPFPAKFDCAASTAKYKQVNPLSADYKENDKITYSNAEVSCGGGLTKISTSGGPLVKSIGESCTGYDQWGGCNKYTATSDIDNNGLNVTCTRPTYTCTNNAVVFSEETFQGSAKWVPKSGYVCLYNVGAYDLANRTTTPPADGQEINYSDYGGHTQATKNSRKWVTEGDILHVSPYASPKSTAFMVGANGMNGQPRVDINDIIRTEGSTIIGWNAYVMKKDACDRFRQYCISNSSWSLFAQVVGTAIGLYPVGSTIDSIKQALNSEFGGHTCYVADWSD